LIAEAAKLLSYGPPIMHHRPDGRFLALTHSFLRRTEARLSRAHA
jgi:hypothetical protein